MLFYAGIDEAGYGPVLGPLVVARTVFRLNRAKATGTPTSLWATMKSAVCRKHKDTNGRIAVGDSKLLYNSSLGLGRLERGVLSFLNTAGKSPRRLDDLLRLMACDELSRVPDEPWYRDPLGGPELPVEADGDDLLKYARRLSRTARRAEVQVEDMSAALVFAERFNRTVEASGSKAACLWEFVAGHLRFIWEKHAEHHPFVAVDSLGSRKDYRGLLAVAMPWADVVPAGQRPGQSAYKISDGDLGMRVLFRVRCEEAHLPVALASMAAKYLRELLMLRFRAFWLDRAPGVKPTYGYLPDGRRFIGEIEPLIRSLGIKRESLVRSR